MVSIMKNSTIFNLLIFSMSNMTSIKTKSSLLASGTNSLLTFSMNQQKNTNNYCKIPSQLNRNYDLIQQLSHNYSLCALETIMSNQVIDIIICDMSHKSARINNIATSQTYPSDNKQSGELKASQRTQSPKKSRGKVQQFGGSQKKSNKVTKIGNNIALRLQQKMQKALFVEPSSKFDSFEKIISRLLNQIQLLNYQEPLPQLKQRFVRIVKNYVTFNDIFPKHLNKMGEHLLKDGIFHEMWGKVCKKQQKQHDFPNYYGRYIKQIVINHSNFQNAFNQIASSYDITYNLQEDSNTRLTQNNSLVFATMRHQNADKTINQSIIQQNQNIFGERLRLLNCINSNKRRLSAEIVCYFLGIKRCFHYIDLTVKCIHEFYQIDDKVLLILEAFMPIFNEEHQKELIDIKQPRFLIAMYGYVSFGQLLRIKQQYQTIEGFILFDQLTKIDDWVQKNGEENHKVDI